MKILVANLGSTSFKFRLFDMSDERQLARGGVERVGAPRSDAFVEIGGVRFEPGDLVFADIDGIVVVPKAIEQEALTRAWNKVHEENITRDAIKQGMKATDAYKKYGTL